MRLHNSWLMTCSKQYKRNGLKWSTEWRGRNILYERYPKNNYLVRSNIPTTQCQDIQVGWINKCIQIMICISNPIFSISGDGSEDLQRTPSWCLSQNLGDDRWWFVYVDGIMLMPFTARHSWLSYLSSTIQIVRKTLPRTGLTELGISTPPPLF